MYLRLQGLDDGVVVVDGDTEHAVRVLDRGRRPRAHMHRTQPINIGKHFFKQPMSNCYKGYMLNNNISTHIPSVAV